MALKEALIELVANDEFRVKRQPHATETDKLLVADILCTPTAAEALKSYGIAIDPGASEKFPNAGVGITQRKFADYDISKYCHRVKVADSFRGGPERDSLITQLGGWDVLEEIFRNVPELTPKNELRGQGAGIVSR